jgi:hypothetical protein
VLQQKAMCEPHRKKARNIPPLELRPFSITERTIVNIPAKYFAPVTPFFQSMEARVRSFENWSKPYFLTQALVDAGFYYTGIDDKVSCFYCNGGLHQWSDNDNPWVEHARWFSHCPYVYVVKGYKFVQEAVQKHPPILPISQYLALYAKK